MVNLQANEVELSYLHSDHLGSNSLMTDATGSVVPSSQAAYLPFGDWRTEPATSTLTDLGYTGHRHNNLGGNDLGLIYMNARYYIPGLARFASADTIIPDEVDPQTYNRFSYVENNPLFYIDPTGHYGCTPYGYLDCSAPTQPYNPTYDMDVDIPEPNYPIYGSQVSKEYPCTFTLSQCFNYTDPNGTRLNWVKDLSEYDESNPIPEGEFVQLLTAVALELYLHTVDSPGYDGERSAYDTPFYNGGGNATDGLAGAWAHDQQVCIETYGCWGRSEINYFAQGMWSAAAGEPLWRAYLTALGWKATEYGELPSEGTLYWIRIGYLYYQDLEASLDDSQ